MSDHMFRPDRPITSSEEDKFERSQLASNFAGMLCSLDCSEGAVVGVFGPWGSGKSSFINLVKEHLNETPKEDPSGSASDGEGYDSRNLPLAVIDFNPWLFSGTQQLVEHFFSEIAAELKSVEDRKLSKRVTETIKTVAERLVEYGHALSPVYSAAGPLGASAAVSTGTAHRFFKKRSQSRSTVQQLRRTISDRLRDLDRPIVVVIDDIDRLYTSEIRDIFKLVRLTASFPNLLYILAFDRDRVEQALSEDHLPGADYLEKIIQFPFDLPELPSEPLSEALLEQLSAIIDPLGDRKINDARLVQALSRIIKPLVTTMRDVSRLVVSARLTLQDTRLRTVDLGDLLAMETIRVLRPTLFVQLCTMREALTAPATDSFGNLVPKPEHRQQIDGLLASETAGETIVRDLLSHVFPATNQYQSNSQHNQDSVRLWRLDHRLACREFLDLYLEHVGPTILNSFVEAEHLVDLMNHPDAFRRKLAEIPSKSVLTVIGFLDDFQGKFPTDHVADIIAALLNLLPRIPRDAEFVSGLIRFDRVLTISSVIHRMLKQLDSNEDRATVVTAALGHVEAYSSKLDLIQSVGYREHIGSQLVSEEAAQRLEGDLARELKKTNPPHNFDIEWNLFSVNQFIAEDPTNPSPLKEERRPAPIRAILESASGKKRFRRFKNSLSQQISVLEWETLTQLFGGEGNLRAAVNELRKVDGDSELVCLADQYLDGTHPMLGQA